MDSPLLEMARVLVRFDQVANTSNVIRGPLVPRTTRGQLTVIVVIKRIGVADHHLANGRGGSNMIGQLAAEHRKQAVGMSDCAADRHRGGAVGDVEVRTLNQQSEDLRSSGVLKKTPATR